MTQQNRRFKRAIKRSRENPPIKKLTNQTPSIPHPKKKEAKIQQQEQESRRKGESFRDQQHYPAVKGLDEPSTGKLTTPPCSNLPCRHRSLAMSSANSTLRASGNARSSFILAGNPFTTSIDGKDSTRIMRKAIKTTRIIFYLPFSLSSSLRLKKNRFFFKPKEVEWKKSMCRLR